MTSPFATAELQALRQRLAKPTPRTIAETIRRKDPTPMPAPSTTPAPSGKVDRRLDGNRPKTPHTVHLREFDMADGRKLLIDRRSIAFICEAKPEEHPASKSLSSHSARTCGPARWPAPARL